MFLNITLVLGYRLLCLTGLYSFCHITFFAIGAYTSALLSSKLGYPVWICFIAAGVVAALFSMALIIPAARVRGVYFFLVTFGFLEVMNSVFLHWSSLTGGDAGILVAAPIIGTGTQTQDYFVILAFALVTVLVMYRIERSRFGRELAPIGSAEGLAAVSGINVLRNRVLAFAIGAAFAGLAGSLFAHDAAYISANDFSWWGTIYILVWLVDRRGAQDVGSDRSERSSMTLIAECLRMSGILQALFYSGVLLLVVMVMPQGIVGLVDYVRAKVGRARASGDEDPPPVDGSRGGEPVMPILEVHQLSKRFGGVEALSQVDLVVEPGEVIGVIGPNGAGKSTFFNLLSGVMKPSAGKVVFQGQDVTGMKPHGIAEARSRADVPEHRAVLRPQRVRQRPRRLLTSRRIPTSWPTSSDCRRCAAGRWRCGSAPRRSSNWPA